MHESMLFKQDAHAATITLNRPHAMNCLDESMANALFDAAAQIHADQELKVVILNSSSAHFMGGGDVKFFYEKRATIHEDVLRIIDKVHGAIEYLRTSNAIVVASARGSIAGFGLSLLLASDLIILSNKSKLTTAYSKIGTSPDGGLTYILPKLIGHKKAMQWLMFSDFISPEEARDLGLVNWVVNDDALDIFTDEVKGRILSGPLLVFSKLKKLLATSEFNDLTKQLNTEKEAFVASTQTKDFHEGIRAFVHKEIAEFTGT